MEHMEPWKMAREVQEERQQQRALSAEGLQREGQLKALIHVALETVRVSSVWLSPVTPKVPCIHTHTFSLSFSVALMISVYVCRYHGRCLSGWECGRMSGVGRAQRVQ